MEIVVETVEVNFLITYNVGGMVSCRLRATSLSNYRELQAGGNASIYKMERKTHPSERGWDISDLPLG